MSGTHMPDGHWASAKEFTLAAGGGGVGGVGALGVAQRQSSSAPAASLPSR